MGEERPGEPSRLGDFSGRYKDTFSNLRLQKEYRNEMSRHHSEEYDWRKEPIDSQALYDSSGGKSHGRYSMFNGMIDSRQVQRRSSSQNSGGSSSRQRRTTHDMDMERLELRDSEA
ncbi:hypothetical protein U9M48_012664 [Paspalum notatum var. saurae]|uniref:Uncharacterized protein n=1 Tax=Paspalum notatum var. saurae TaxID=547442 RepID=A0AAQ3SXZ3_PASNO